MLRTMRSNAKWIFYILAIAFVAWLGIGQVMSILGPSGNVVLRVNGREFQVTEYQQRVQLASEQYRQQNGTAPLTREEDQQIQNQVINQMIQDALLEQEYNRLGIRVSAEEIIDMAHNSPPPEVMRDPQFQTDSQFDIRKWQQFLATTSDRNLLAQIEGIYREQIPRIKLAQYLTSDVYITDAKLWRIYRDQHDSVTVASLAVSPLAIPDTTTISDAELSAYVKKHPDDYKRPGVAYVRFIVIPRVPDAADSAAARARVARVRSELVSGAKFEDVARRESSDSGSGQRGGDLGWMRRTETGFVEPSMRAVRALKPGQLSTPVASQFGYHLIRIDQAKGDSVKVRHILIPVSVQDVADLDRVSLRLVDADQVVAELRRDGRGQLAGFERPHGPHGRLHETRLGPSHPAEVAAPLPAARIARLAAGDVFELGATHQLAAHARDACPRRRAVGGIRYARDHDEPHIGDARPFVVVGMLLDVCRQLGVTDRRGVRDCERRHRERGDRDRVVLVPVDAPQLGVGDVDVTGEILRELDARNLLAVNAFDLRQQVAIGRRRQELLPFADIELAVGLELRIAHHLGRRRVVRHVDDFFGTDANAEAVVLPLDQSLLNPLFR